MMSLSCWNFLSTLPVVAVALLALTTTSAFSSSSQFRGHQVTSNVPVTKTSTALCMKTIAVFGASGLTASECVYQALKNGDTVVGLTRYRTPFSCA